MAAKIEMNRMYKCLKCSTADPAFKGTKPQIEGHLWKHHISLDQAPFYYTLCLYRCGTEKELVRHEKTFRPNLNQRESLTGSGSQREDTFYFKSCLQPYIFENGRDFVAMTRDESRALCLSKRAKEDNSSSGPAEQPATDANQTDEAVIGAILSRDEDEHMDTTSSSSSSSSSSSTGQPTEVGGEVPPAKQYQRQSP